MKLKRLIATTLLALSLAAIPKPVLAYDGCSAVACWSTGSYIEWSWFGPYYCSWWVVSYFAGDTIYGDCHSNYTY